MGDEEIRASLEGQDGSTFSIISHCTRVPPEVILMFLVTPYRKSVSHFWASAGFRSIKVLS